MAAYILKRLLLFVPALVLVSLLIFALSKLTPGDPVQIMLQNEGSYAFQEGILPDQEAYQKMSERLGLDKPNFYFSVSAIAFPDTLHRIVVKEYHHALNRLINQFGNWPEIQQYYHQLRVLNNAIISTPDSLRTDTYIDIRRTAGQLFVQHQADEINRLIGSLAETASSVNGNYWSTAIGGVQQSFSDVLEKATPWRLYIPKVQWWGFDNQYHRWITRFFKGDFGTSYVDGRPVSRKMGEALWWTLLMNVLSLFFILMLSVPLGIYLATKKNERVDRYTSLLLFGLYSLPVFWVATLLLVFFTTPEYGQWTNLFAGPGLGELRSTAPFGDRFWERGSHLVLPVFCLTYASLAFVTRQIRGSMVEVLDLDFIRTARAKGLNEKIVIWKHAFRNALFPLISLLAMVVPRLLAGSVIVEFIFAIPGMGRLMFDAIFDQNWPVVYTVLLLTALLTMLANLLADFGYAWADPRVAFGKRADKKGMV